MLDSFLKNTLGLCSDFLSYYLFFFNYKDSMKNKLFLSFRIVFDILIFIIVFIQLQRFGGTDGEENSIFYYKFNELLPMLTIFILIVMIFLKNIFLNYNINLLVIELLVSGVG